MLISSIVFQACHFQNSKKLEILLRSPDVQRRTARGSRGLPRVSPGLAMPYPYMPCRRANPETTLRPFQGLPAHRAGSLRPSSIPLDTPRHTPLRMSEDPRNRVTALKRLFDDSFFESEFTQVKSDLKE
jgi:hypothetical protein